MHESEMFRAKRCSIKPQHFIYERRRIWCPPALEECRDDWCEIDQHQVIMKGTKLGHPGLQPGSSR